MYISQRLRGLKGTTSYGPTSRYVSDVIEDGDQYSSAMRHETSLQIARMEWDVLKLWLSELHRALMNNSAAKLRRNAQARRERDHAKPLSEKMLLYIDASVTSISLSPLTAPPSTKFLSNGTTDTRNCAFEVDY